MILSNRNDLLYDSKNFDKYRNIYVVKINVNKEKHIQEQIRDLGGKLKSEYDAYTLTLYLYFLAAQVNLNGIYKIIYGHYYNNQNLFLYKDLHNKKVIKSTISYCKNNELMYNNLNDLIYSNSYDVLKSQINVLLNTKEERIKTLSPISVTYNNGNLNITSNGKLSTSFSNGCLEIKNT